MDVVGHDNEFVDGRIGEVGRNLEQELGGDLTVAVQVLDRTEETLLFVGTNGDEIVIGRGVVVVRDAVGLAFGMVHVCHLCTNSPECVGNRGLVLRNGHDRSLHYMIPNMREHDKRGISHKNSSTFLWRFIWGASVRIRRNVSKIGG